VVDINRARSITVQWLCWIYKLHILCCRNANPCIPSNPNCSSCFCWWDLYLTLPGRWGHR